MKKIFSIIGLVSLISISFVIQQKTNTVIKNIDEIMEQINKEYPKYEEQSIDAKIEKNTIIPGLEGKKIDKNKSYEKMKQIGIYNNKYYVYEPLPPKTSLKKTYDKYITSGNPNKNMVSLIFTVYNKDDIATVKNILKTNNIQATFFIDNTWLENNNEEIIELIKQGHTIGNLSKNMDYTKTEYIWINNIIKKISNQKQNYCYAIEENEENLEACTIQKNYTIKPNIIIKQNPLTTVKEKIKSGSLISMNINENTNQELQLIINYIKSRDFKLENIEKHISEKKEN